MKLKSLFSSLLIVLAALIWGVAFVAQSEAMDSVGPFTFMVSRSFLGGTVLVPLTLILRMARPREKKEQENKKTLLIGGICCGAALALASALQQYGIALGAEAGKAGFLTALYIIIVPLIGIIFFKKKYSLPLWIGVAASLVGLYLLCMTGESSFSLADILLLLCAVVFSVHILVIDHFSPRVDCVAMSCIQFFVCGLICTLPMFIFEKPTFDAIFAARSEILYAGIMSSGVAYTLQIVAQKRTPPVLASMLFSLESVFALLSGWIILNERLSAIEIIGCLVMFGAIILAQLSTSKNEEK